MGHEWDRKILVSGNQQHDLFLLFLLLFLLAFAAQGTFELSHFSWSPGRQAYGFGTVLGTERKGIPTSCLNVFLLNEAMMQLVVSWNDQNRHFDSQSLSSVHPRLSLSCPSPYAHHLLPAMHTKSIQSALLSSFRRPLRSVVAGIYRSLINK